MNLCNLGDVIAVLQEGFKKRFGDTPITVGGVLVMMGGTANIHV